jgi:tetratricopeptide (TPR) repeat protein
VVLASAGVLIAVIVIGERAAIRSLVIEGNDALRHDDLPKAERLYRQALARRPGSGEAHLGLGIAAYRQHRLNEALEEFARAEPSLFAARDRARANFNRGNASFGLGQLRDALEAYKMTLRLDPSDEDARYNLALVTRLLQNQEQSAAGSTARNRVERLAGSLGRPKVRVSGTPEPLSARPAPGSPPAGVDK